METYQVELSADLVKGLEVYAQQVPYNETPDERTDEEKKQQAVQFILQNTLESFIRTTYQTKVGNAEISEMAAAISEQA